MLKNKKARPFLIVGVIALVCGLVLTLTHASGFFVSLEPEVGVNSPATAQSDSNASGGKYVRFGDGGSQNSGQNPYPDRGSAGFTGSPSSLTVIDSSSSAPAGTMWTSYGLRVTSSNVTLSNVHVKGGIYASGGGTLTIRDSIIEGGAAWYIVTLRENTKIDAERVTFRWRDGSPRIDAENGAGAVHLGAGTYSDSRIVNCDISGVADGLQIAGDRWIVTDNWIHDLALGPTTHNDGIQVFGGSGHLIARNRIESGAINGHSTGAIFTQGGSIGDLTIKDNFLDGGAYTIYLENGSVTVVDNIVGPNHVFGTRNILPSVTVTNWSNNCRGDSNGNKLSPCQSLSP